MGTSYATVAEYREDTGEIDSPDATVTARLAQQSAKLRAICGITESRKLTEDQLTLARMLVTDAVGKSLKTVAVEGLGDVSGARQASFTANGFQGSYTFSNPTGAAYFDQATLKALMRSLGRSQSMGTVMPSYGRRS